jgi:hypothetical protein
MNMMTDQMPLAMPMAVIQALHKIEVDILENMDVSDETDSVFEYANYYYLMHIKVICSREEMCISFMN